MQISPQPEDFRWRYVWENDSSTSKDYGGIVRSVIRCRILMISGFPLNFAAFCGGVGVGVDYRGPGFARRYLRNRKTSGEGMHSSLIAQHPLKRAA